MKCCSDDKYSGLCVLVLVYVGDWRLGIGSVILGPEMIAEQCEYFKLFSLSLSLSF